MSKLWITIVTFAITAFALPASAQAGEPPSADQLITWVKSGKPSKDVALAIVQSYSVAYTFSNASLELRGVTPLFCQPGDLAITADQAFSIMERLVKAEPQSGKLSAAAVLLIALQKMFPCDPEP